MITQQNYVGQLLYRVPEFTDTYNEYIVFMDGDLRGHPLFGELYRFTICNLQVQRLGVVDRVIEFINLAAQSEDDYITELVHLSFIEYLPNLEENTYIVERLNPAAKAILDTVVNWEPSVA